ncbi:MAG: DUF3047 domain-containing protein [Candidatus Omnitrophica bacterium]|nr:DUF3047 domain-containing protein [Candidatus Omnitrophota bacterium]MDD5488065.1 DUF3047 domain-containing protein [Candidatus Omnitrophota bacterium]
MRKKRPILLLVFLVAVVIFAVLSGTLKDRVSSVIAALFHHIRVQKEELPALPGMEEYDIERSFDFDSSSGLDEWEQQALAPKSTDYSIFPAETTGSMVKAESQGGASAIILRYSLDRERRPFVSWDWKIGEFPGRKEDETLGKKKEFDFAAQMYVVFHAGFFLNTKAIQYVWTEHIPAGTVTASPYTKNVMIKVLESGAAGEWKREFRDIAADYRELFGRELKYDVLAIAFMTDADSTGTIAQAYYDNVTFGYMDQKPLSASDAGEAAIAVQEEPEVGENER